MFLLIGRQAQRCRYFILLNGLRLFDRDLIILFDCFHKWIGLGWLVLYGEWLTEGIKTREWSLVPELDCQFQYPIDLLYHHYRLSWIDLQESWRFPRIIDILHLIITTFTSPSWALAKECFSFIPSGVTWKIYASPSAPVAINWSPFPLNWADKICLVGFLEWVLFDHMYSDFPHSSPV